jgi:hypothetical protein
VLLGKSDILFRLIRHLRTLPCSLVYKKRLMAKVGIF